MNMNQFTESHPGHPLSNAYGLMKQSKINAEKRLLPDGQSDD